MADTHSDPKAKEPLLTIANGCDLLVRYVSRWEVKRVKSLTVYRFASCRTPLG